MYKIGHYILDIYSIIKLSKIILGAEKNVLYDFLRFAMNTACPTSHGPFYIESCYLNWAETVDRILDPF